MHWRIGVPLPALSAVRRVMTEVKTASPPEHAGMVWRTDRSAASPIMGD